MGGEGIGYHDLNETNLGDGIRSDHGVDTGTEHENGSILAIQSGEWLEYTIDVQMDGKYNIDVYFATPNRYGKFHLEINQEDITGEVYVTPSGSNSVYRATTLTNIELKKGIQVLRVYFDFANYKMGSIKFERIIPVSALEINSAENFQIYPNPAKEILHINFTVERSLRIDLSLVSASGQHIKTLENKIFEPGFYSITENIAYLKPGIYLVRFNSGNSIKHHKLLLN